MSTFQRNDIGSLVTIRDDRLQPTCDEMRERKEDERMESIAVLLTQLK